MKHSFDCVQSPAVGIAQESEYRQDVGARGPYIPTQRAGLESVNRTAQGWVYWSYALSERRRKGCEQGGERVPRRAV